MNAVVAELPKAAATLVATATAHGWAHLIQHGTDTGDNPFIRIEVAASGAAGRRGWYFSFTWHTRDNAGRYRLFSSVALTPEQRGWATPRSLKATLGAIAANPVPTG